MRQRQHWLPMPQWEESGEETDRATQGVQPAFQEARPSFLFGLPAWPPRQPRNLPRVPRDVEQRPSADRARQEQKLGFVSERADDPVIEDADDLVKRGSFDDAVRRPCDLNQTSARVGH
jgi:hypothetical protein